MSVKRAQQEIDAVEYTEWLAYHKLNPFGEQRADLRAGIIASVVASVFGKKTYKASDFMPDFECEDKPVNQQAALKSILKARGVEFK